MPRHDRLFWSSLCVLAHLAPFHPASAAPAFHTIAIQPITDPAGYTWPYNLRMFQGNGAISPSGAGGALANGVARGIGRIDNARSAITETILNDNNVKLGADAVADLRDALSRQGFEIVDADKPAEMILTVSLEKLGWLCDGILMDGECKPRIHAKTTLIASKTGKRLFNESCIYGAQSFLIPCGIVPPDRPTITALPQVLSDPANANDRLRQALRQLCDYIASEIKTSQ